MAQKTIYPELLSDEFREDGRSVGARASELGARTVVSVADGLKGVAEKLDDPSAPEGVRSKMAETLTGAAHYLEEVHPQSAIESVEAAVRAHPYRTIAVCLSIGWLAGRLARD